MALRRNRDYQLVFVRQYDVFRLWRRRESVRIANGFSFVSMDLYHFDMIFLYVPYTLSDRFYLQRMFLRCTRMHFVDRPTLPLI